MSSSFVWPSSLLTYRWDLESYCRDCWRSSTVGHSLDHDYNRQPWNLDSHSSADKWTNDVSVRNLVRQRVNIHDNSDEADSWRLIYRDNFW